MCSLPDRGRTPAASVPRADPPVWRLLVDEPLPGAVNMARDHALAALARPGTGTLRFYRWSPATLSMGRNEPVTPGYRQLLRRHPEMGVVRRPTGGRAVLHDREVTYSVVLPVRVFGGLRPAYGKINEGLVEGLRRLGVDAARATGGPGRARNPEAGPCFLEPARGEVVVRGRKLVGSAQARIGGAILQHGSLLLVADQEALFSGGHGERRGPAGCGDGVAREPRRAITLAELGEVPPWNRLVAELAAGFEHVVAGRWSRGSLTGSERALAAKLEKRYGSREWTWRR
ncbi:MAG: biotin/lipoate A/B protein ligase family protein [Gemmatimonadota bacterium]|nr:biotin/lipoate A/B protein ligase family protein [Gemmatimonadota bacterium]MDE2872142.1 biotin/lipoate A/B protein ligase family protein [Gemmatimonadota bacterium]